VSRAKPTSVEAGVPRAELDPALIERLIEVRRAIHRNPELSNQEVETTARLRREIEAAGVDRISLVGRTGLIADIVGTKTEPVVAVRADLDALPLDEEADVPFRSQVPNVMHACGHDVHSAMILGVALVAVGEPLAGTLRIIFQPAEETEPLGGRAVVEGGHLDGVSAAVALHVDPTLDVGRVGLRAGPTMASSDEFTITVRGRSSHAGWPHVGADAISTAAAVVQGVQTLVARRVDPLAPVTLNVGRIDGGRASNIVPDEVRLEGVVRSLDERTRSTVRRVLGEVVEHVCAAHGAQGSLELTRGEPVLENDPVVIEALAASAARVLGTEAIEWLDRPTMNSEDFAFYSESVPSGMAWIGVRNEAKGIVHPLHDPRFAVDEDVIPLGVSLLLQTAAALLEGGSSP
jgi:amidohydrolase